MEIVNRKIENYPIFHPDEARVENRRFLYSFYGFSLLTLPLVLRQFDIAWPYKIAIFYTGLLIASGLILNSYSARKLTLAWQKSRKGALKLMALL